MLRGTAEECAGVERGPVLLLIDGHVIDPSAYGAMMEQLGALGYDPMAADQHLYGDWSQPHMQGWNAVVHRYGICLHQVFPYPHEDAGIARATSMLADGVAHLYSSRSDKGGALLVSVPPSSRDPGVGALSRLALQWRGAAGSHVLGAGPAMAQADDGAHPMSAFLRHYLVTEGRVAEAEAPMPMPRNNTNNKNNMVESTPLTSTARHRLPSPVGQRPAAAHKGLEVDEGGWMPADAIHHINKLVDDNSDWLACGDDDDDDDDNDNGGGGDGALKMVPSAWSSWQGTTAAAVANACAASSVSPIAIPVSASNHVLSLRPVPAPTPLGESDSIERARQRPMMICTDYDDDVYASPPTRREAEALVVVESGAATATVPAAAAAATTASDTTTSSVSCIPLPSTIQSVMKAIADLRAASSSSNGGEEEGPGLFVPVSQLVEALGPQRMNCIFAQGHQSLTKFLSRYRAHFIMTDKRPQSNHDALAITDTSSALRLRVTMGQVGTDSSTTLYVRTRTAINTNTNTNTTTTPTMGQPSTDEECNSGNAPPPPQPEGGIASLSLSSAPPPQRAAELKSLVLKAVRKLLPTDNTKYGIPASKVSQRIHDMVGTFSVANFGYTRFREALDHMGAPELRWVAVPLATGNNSDNYIAYTPTEQQQQQVTPEESVTTTTTTTTTTRPLLHPIHGIPTASVALPFPRKVLDRLAVALYKQMQEMGNGVPPTGKRFQIDLVHKSLEQAMARESAERITLSELVRCVENMPKYYILVPPPYQAKAPATAPKMFIRCLPSTYALSYVELSYERLGDMITAARMHAATLPAPPSTTTTAAAAAAAAPPFALCAMNDNNGVAVRPRGTTFSLPEAKKLFERALRTMGPRDDKVHGYLPSRVLEFLARQGTVITPALVGFPKMRPMVEAMGPEIVWTRVPPDYMRLETPAERAARITAKGGDVTTMTPKAWRVSAASDDEEREPWVRRSPFAILQAPLSSDDDDPSFWSNPQTRKEEEVAPVVSGEEEEEKRPHEAAPASSSLIQRRAYVEEEDDAEEISSSNGVRKGEEVSDLKEENGNNHNGKLLTPAESLHTGDEAYFEASLARLDGDASVCSSPSSSACGGEFRAPWNRFTWDPYGPYDLSKIGYDKAIRNALRDSAKRMGSAVGSYVIGLHRSYGWRTADEWQTAQFITLFHPSKIGISADRFYQTLPYMVCCNAYPTEPHLALWMRGARDPGTFIKPFYRFIDADTCESDELLRRFLVYIVARDHYTYNKGPKCVAGTEAIQCDLERALHHVLEQEFGAELDLLLSYAWVTKLRYGCQNGTKQHHRDAMLDHYGDTIRCMTAVIRHLARYLPYIFVTEEEEKAENEYYYLRAGEAENGKRTMLSVPWTAIRSFAQKSEFLQRFVANMITAIPARIGSSGRHLLRLERRLRSISTVSLDYGFHPSKLKDLLKLLPNVELNKNVISVVPSSPTLRVKMLTELCPEFIQGVKHRSNRSVHISLNLELKAMVLTTFIAVSRKRHSLSDKLLRVAGYAVCDLPASKLLDALTTYFPFFDYSAYGYPSFAELLVDLYYLRCTMDNTTGERYVELAFNQHASDSLSFQRLEFAKYFCVRVPPVFERLMPKLLALGESSPDGSFTSRQLTEAIWPSGTSTDFARSQFPDCEEGFALSPFVSFAGTVGDDNDNPQQQNKKECRYRLDYGVLSRLRSGADKPPQDEEWERGRIDEVQRGSGDYGYVPLRRMLIAFADAIRVVRTGLGINEWDNAVPLFDVMEFAALDGILKGSVVGSFHFSFMKARDLLRHMCGVYMEPHPDNPLQDLVVVTEAARFREYSADEVASLHYIYEMDSRCPVFLNPKIHIEYPDDEIRSRAAADVRTEVAILADAVD